MWNDLSIPVFKGVSSVHYPNLQSNWRFLLIQYVYYWKSFMLGKETSKGTFWLSQPRYYGPWLSTTCLFIQTLADHFLCIITHSYKTSQYALYISVYIDIVGHLKKISLLFQVDPRYALKLILTVLWSRSRYALNHFLLYPLTVKFTSSGNLSCNTLLVTHSSSGLKCLHVISRTLTP